MSHRVCVTRPSAPRLRRSNVPNGRVSPVLRGKCEYAGLVLALCVASCTPAVGPADASHLGTVTALEAVTVTELTATVGREVTPTPAVRARDQAGKPVPGIKVSFSVLGADRVANASAVTDQAGIASAGAWVLGTTPGAHTATASADGAADVRFTATAVAGPAASLTLVDGDNQTMAPGRSLPLPLRVRVADSFGNPVRFVRVTFVVVSGGGTIANNSTLSDSMGLAVSGPWTLGVEAGMQTARAQIDSGLVSFSAFACDADCVAANEIVYVRDGQIASTDLLGDHVRQLTTDASRRESDPAWSPDGRKIAFSRDITSPGGIYRESDEVWTMNADGSDVTFRVLGYHSPTWSPDGAWLAITKGDCIYYCDVFVMSTAATDSLRIIPVISQGAFPAWSPDGKKIAYVSLSGDDGYHALEMVNADGKGDVTTIVPRDEGAIDKPVWSPDGRHIAFSKCLLGICDLYSVHPDGSGLTRLTSIGSVYGGAAWSPDGERIAFTLRPLPPSYDRNASLVMYMPAAGGPAKYIATGYQPAWRPKAKP